MPIPDVIGGRKLTQQNFLDRAFETHGDSYDYSEVVYKNNKTKIKILCKEHKPFWQRPDMHLQGQGCPACGGVQRHTTQSFREDIENLYSGISLPEDFVYINNKQIANIVCDKHGEQKRIIVQLLSGRGCPKCGSERGGGFNFTRLSLEDYESRLGTLYVIKLYDLDKTPFYKFGVCYTERFETRMKTLQKQVGIDLKVVYTNHFDSALKAYELEQLLKSEVDRYYSNINFHGYTECFKSDSLEKYLEAYK